MELSEADNGRRIQVGAGERVVVRLPENATTGYVWQVASLTGPARLVADRAEPGAAAPGAGGVRCLELAFDSSGAVTLRAVQRRPWEPDTSVVSEYRLDLSVGT
jgi:inhibitor of cysteine peptidase